MLKVSVENLQDFYQRISVESSFKSGQLMAPADDIFMSCW